MKPNWMNTMKKSKPDKDTLLQYIFDYGIEGTTKLLKVTESDIDSILYPSKESYSQHKFIYTILYPNIELNLKHNQGIRPHT